MKSIPFLILISLFFSSCGHSVVRTGYLVNKSDYKNCDVVIKKSMDEIGSEEEKVGKLRLGETGFSVACSEEHAIRILKNEACALGANLIVIIDEQRPNLWSSCYRCTAYLYKTNKSGIVDLANDDPVFDEAEVEQRVAVDRSNNAGAMILGALVGVLVGVLVLSASN